LVCRRRGDDDQVDIGIVYRGSFQRQTRCFFGYIESKFAFCGYVALFNA